MTQIQRTTTYTLGCPACGSTHIVKMGVRNGQQRYLCRSCRKAFRANGKAKGRRTDAELMGSAIRDYYSGKSYKQIAERLAEKYDIPEPSKATVFEWVRDYTAHALGAMGDRKAATSGHWVADEMYVNVGVKTAYNWNVMDSETRYILASHLSPTRDGRAAKAVIRKALESADGPPKTIKTDKWRAYIKPIKELAPEAKHFQSEGLSAEINNNRSERLQGTYHDREKTLRRLNGIESGQRYLDGWTLQHNLFGKHHSLGNRTPGEAAKVDAPFREWADVVRGNTVPKFTVLDTPGERVRLGPSPVPRTPPVDLDLSDLEASSLRPSRQRFVANAQTESPQRVRCERSGRRRGRGLLESHYQTPKWQRRD